MPGLRRCRRVGRVLPEVKFEALRECACMRNHRSLLQSEASALILNTKICNLIGKYTARPEGMDEMVIHSQLVLRFLRAWLRSQGFSCDVRIVLQHAPEIHFREPRLEVNSIWFVGWQHRGHETPAIQRLCGIQSEMESPKNKERVYEN